MAERRPTKVSRGPFAKDVHSVAAPDVPPSGIKTGAARRRESRRRKQKRDSSPDAAKGKEEWLAEQKALDAEYEANRPKDDFLCRQCGADFENPGELDEKGRCASCYLKNSAGGLCPRCQFRTLNRDVFREHIQHRRLPGRLLPSPVRLMRISMKIVWMKQMRMSFSSRMNSSVVMMMTVSDAERACGVENRSGVFSHPYGVFPRGSDSVEGFFYTRMVFFPA